jgi:hypothetical protein
MPDPAALIRRSGSLAPVPAAPRRFAARSGKTSQVAAETATD